MCDKNEKIVSNKKQCVYIYKIYIYDKLYMIYIYMIKELGCFYELNKKMKIYYEKG